MKILPGLIVMLVVGCTNPKQTVENDETLNRFYSADERVELAGLLSYVDSVVMQQTHNNLVDSAYHEFFSSFDLARYQLTSVVPEDEKYTFLEKMKPEVFNSIFMFETADNSTFLFRDTTLVIKKMTINTNGKYFDYLADKGNSDTFYKELVESTKAMGGVSASLVPYYITHHNQFDYTSVKDRLFAAVLILSLEDNTNIKLDRYYNRS
nr:hypothetical protein [uncultured Carboxylicivirga sp.]